MAARALANMQASPHCAATQVIGCNKFCSLVRLSELARNGAVGTILAGLRRHGEEADVAESGCRALLHFERNGYVSADDSRAAGDEALRVLVRFAKGDEKVARSWDAPRVCESVLRLLDLVRAQLPRDRAGEMLEATLGVMKRFRLFSVIYFEMLAKFVETVGEMLGEEQKMEVVEIVGNALEREKESTTTTNGSFGAVCGVIISLLRREENHAIVMKSKVIPIVLGRMAGYAAASTSSSELATRNALLQIARREQYYMDDNSEDSNSLDLGIHAKLDGEFLANARKGCTIIESLAKNENNLDDLMKLGAVDSVLKTMTNYSTDSTVQDSCLAVVLAFAALPKFWPELNKLGAKAVLERSIKTHRGAEGWRYAFGERGVKLELYQKALDNLASAISPIEKSELTIELAAKALDESLKYRKIENLIISCEFLIEKTDEDPSSSSYVRESTITQAIKYIEPDTIANGLKHYLEVRNAQVVTLLLSLLKNFTSKFEGSGFVDNVELIIEAMTIFPKNSEVGIRILLNLANYGKSYFNIIHSTAIKVLVDAVNNALTSKEALSDACHTLAKLSARYEGGLRMLTDGVLEALCLGIKSMVPDSNEIVVAIGRLASSSPGGEQQLLRTQCIGEIFDIMKASPYDLDLQKQACQIIGMFAKDPKNHAMLMDYNAIDQIVKAIETHPNIGDAAFRSLKQLTNKNLAAQKKLLELGAVEMLCRLASEVPMRVGDSTLAGFLPPMTPPDKFDFRVQEVTKLQKTLSELEKLNKTNDLNIKRTNLFLILNQHRMTVTQQAMKVDREAMLANMSGKSVDELLADLKESERNLRDGEEYLGTDMLSPETTKSDWLEKATSRDRSRERILKIHDEMNSASGHFLEVLENASHPTFAVERMEAKIQGLTNQLKRGSSGATTSTATREEKVMDNDMKASYSENEAIVVERALKLLRSTSSSSPSTSSSTGDVDMDNDDDEDDDYHEPKKEKEDVVVIVDDVNEEVILKGGSSITNNAKKEEGKANKEDEANNTEAPPPKRPRLERANSSSMKKEVSPFAPLDWLVEFRDQQTQGISDAKGTLETKLSQLESLIREIEACAGILSNSLRGARDRLSKQRLETIVSDADEALEERKSKTLEYQKRAKALEKKEVPTALDIERERKLHNRRVEINKQMDQLAQLARNIKAEKKRFKTLELNELDEGLLEEEQLALQSKKRDIETRIQDLEKEREEIKVKIVALSRHISEEEKEEEGKFDFPELPLLATMASDPNRSTINKYSTKSDTVKQMLQESRFFSERSLKDFEEDDLPDDVKAFSLLPEIQQSSLVFAKLKGPKYQSALGAIKILQPIELTEFKTIRAVVLLASKVHHSSILPIEAVFVDEDKGKVFVQTPFRGGGGSMKYWLEKSPRPMEYKLEALSKIGDALDVIHSHGVVHRNLKLENIIMDSNEDNSTPIICDFGSSSDTLGLFATTSATSEERKLELTRYTAPEMLAQNGITTKEGDVWSFMMLCLITLVFDGKYDQIPTLPDNEGRVDVERAMKVAKRKLLHVSNKPLLDLFERVLNGGEANNRPSIKEVRDVLMNAELCECALCRAEMDDSALYRRIEGCECSGDHFYCRKHFREMVFASAESGEVRCMECGGGAAGADPVLFSEKVIFECAGPDALAAVLKGREAGIQTRLNGASIAGKKRGREEALQEAEVMSIKEIRITQVRLKVESIALPQCPRCRVAIQHTDGCAAMKCLNCGCGFCMFCLTDCGNDAHSHVQVCEHKTQLVGTTTNWGSPEESRAVMTKKIKKDLLAYWEGIQDLEVKKEAAKDPTVKGWLELYQIPNGIYQ